MEEDVQNIIDNSFLFAEKMLIENKEFYPFGVTIDMKGELTFVAYEDEETDSPNSQKVIGELSKTFRSELLLQKLRSYGITYDVKILIDENGGQSDAILMDIIDSEYAGIIKYYFPYKLNQSSDLIFGDSFRRFEKE